MNNSTDLESMKSLIKTQINELADLKKLLAQQKSDKPLASQITTLKPVREVMTMRSNKWNDIPGATELPITIKKEIEKVTVVEILPTKIPVKLEIEPVKSVRISEQKPIQLTSEVKELIRSDNVDIVFPIEHNPFPKVFDNKSFQVTVKRNISIDNLIKELREAAAKQVYIYYYLLLDRRFTKINFDFKGKN